MKSELTDGYPLAWPAGFPRTAPEDRRSWPDRHLTFGKARKTLVEQLETTGAKDIVISCDIERRKTDGMPYANARKPDDPGVAIYFTLNGNPRVLPFDRYDSIESNIRAAAVTVRDMRRIAKRGPQDFLERAYTGFKALPQQTSGEAWWSVLGVEPGADEMEIRTAFRTKAQSVHPDKPDGSLEAWHTLRDARRQGLQIVRSPNATELSTP